MAQRKETKTTIKVRDLKPKKDAKGGVVQNVTYQSQHPNAAPESSQRYPRMERLARSELHC